MTFCKLTDFQSDSFFEVTIYQSDIFCEVIRSEFLNLSPVYPTRPS